MLVVYTGHSKALMTDYNGKRYCFEKDISKEIPEEVYKSILLSGHVDAMEFKQVEAPEEIKIKVEKQEIIPEKKEKKEEEKQKVRPKKKK